MKKFNFFEIAQKIYNFIENENEKYEDKRVETSYKLPKLELDFINAKSVQVCLSTRSRYNYHTEDDKDSTFSINLDEVIHVSLENGTSEEYERIHSFYLFITEELRIHKGSEDGENN